MEEIWKDIPSFEGIYQVSNHGNVRKLEHTSTYINKYGTIVKRYHPPCERKPMPGLNKEYLSINLQHKKNYNIHRLVAIVFIPNPLDLEFVNHKDGNKRNNLVNNLEWVTRQENENHAFSTGLKNSTGSNNTMSKLTEYSVSEILKVKDRSLNSKKKLSEKYGIHRATIERIWNRKIWKHVIGKLK